MNKYTLVAVGANDTKLQTVLRNLTKMYCYEWSQYTGMDVDENGCYAFEKYLPGYWEKPECKAFLLRCENECSNLTSAQASWAGFALIDRDFILHKDYDYSLAEFFVLHKYRRQGAGSLMATSLFETFPGKWELGRNPKNLTAYSFWERLIKNYTGGNYELVCASPAHEYIDGTLGDVFAFDNGKAD